MISSIEGVRLFGEGEPKDLQFSAGGIMEISESTHSDNAGILLPGLVDVHVHFRDPGGPWTDTPPETLESGARSAAAGGFTEVFAMANTSPVTDTPIRWAEMDARAAGLEVGIHPVSALSMGLDGKQLVDIEGMVFAGARIFSDDGQCLQDAGLAREAMQRLAELDAVYAEHAQDRQIVGNGVVDASVAVALGVAAWPTQGEASIVERDIQLAAETGCRVHFCHISTAEAVELVASAKRAGLPITAEVTPHHLLLGAEDARHVGPALKVNPPLRAEHDRRAIRRALLEGLIDIVATDHAPHEASSKSRPWDEAAFGLTGLETALGAVAEVYAEESGWVDWAAVSRVMSANPRRLAGLPAVDLQPSDEASFCLVRESPSEVDPQRHRSQSRNNPFVGRVFRHSVRATWRKGERSYQRPD